MKNRAAIIIMLILVSITAFGNAESAPLKMRLSTRSGPGTEYDEPGTFYQSAWSYTWVDVLSKSWDSRNDIWWIQVDFTYTNGTKYRVWTGQKRVSVNLDYIPEFAPLYETQGWTTYAVTGYYGPGSEYARFGTVPADYDFSVLSIEGDYVEIVYPEYGGSGLHRCWVYNDGSLNITSGFRTPVSIKNSSSCTSSMPGSDILRNRYASICTDSQMKTVNQGSYTTISLSANLSGTFMLMTSRSEIYFPEVQPTEIYVNANQEIEILVFVREISMDYSGYVMITFTPEASSISKTSKNIRIEVVQ